MTSGDRGAGRTEAGDDRAAAAEAARLQLVGKIAAGLAHDLNGPVGVILGFTQLARDKVTAASAQSPEMEALARYLEMIEHAGMNAQTLAGDMWNFARARRGEPVDFDVRGILETAARLVGPALRAASVEPPPAVRATDDSGGPAPVPICRGDTALWTQVLVDLLIQAPAALPKGGSVDCTITPGERGAPVQVALRAVPPNGAGEPGAAREWQCSESAAEIIAELGGEIRREPGGAGGQCGLLISIPAASGGD